MKSPDLFGDTVGTGALEAVKSFLKFRTIGGFSLIKQRFQLNKTIVLKTVDGRMSNPGQTASSASIF
jgi:hypothetical protein